MAFVNRIKAKDDKSKYNIYLGDLNNLALFRKETNVVSRDTNVVSIDIAIKNFAIRREVWKGSPKEVVPKLFHKIDFSGQKESGNASIPADVLIRANDFLNDIFNSHLRNADLILIERQLAVSPKNRSMFDLVLNFLLSRRKLLKPDVIVADINPSMKSKILRPKVRMTSNELKKWSVEKAIEILKERGDDWSIKWLLYHKGDSKTKADDLADTVIQMQAFYEMVCS